MGNESGKVQPRNYRSQGRQNHVETTLLLHVIRGYTEHYSWITFVVILPCDITVRQVENEWAGTTRQDTSLLLIINCVIERETKLFLFLLVILVPRDIFSLSCWWQERCQQQILLGGNSWWSGNKTLGDGHNYQTHTPASLQLSTGRWLSVCRCRNPDALSSSVAASWELVRHPGQR